MGKTAELICILTQATQKMCPHSSILILSSFSGSVRQMEQASSLSSSSAEAPLKESSRPEQDSWISRSS